MSGKAPADKGVSNTKKYKHPSLLAGSAKEKKTKNESASSPSSKRTLTLDQLEAVKSRINSIKEIGAQMLEQTKFTLPPEALANLREVRIGDISEHTKFAIVEGTACEVSGLVEFEYKQGKQKGKPGKLFSFILVGPDAETIKVTGFNGAAVLLENIVHDEDYVVIKNPAVALKNADYDRYAPTTSDCALSINATSSVETVEIEIAE